MRVDACAAPGAGQPPASAADQVNDAYERVLASDVRYRFVLDAGPVR